MLFSTDQLIAIAAAMWVASVIQSAVGFGMGLFAIPILMWAGIALPHAIAIVLAGSFLTSGAATISLRREVPWRHTGIATGLRFVGMVAGVSLLALIATLDVARIKQLVGAVILLVLIVQWLWKVPPRSRVGWPWTIVAFLSSGVMAGTVGMGGPPLVLWVMAHNWSAAKTRAFLLSCFFLMEPVLVCLLAWRFGRDALIATAVGVCCLPLLLIGTAIGLRLGRRISRSRLQAMAFALLMVIALMSVTAPWLSER